MFKSKLIILTILPLTLIISACAPTPAIEPTSTPTAAALSTAARPPATVAPTQTPAPRASSTTAARTGPTIAPGRGQPVQWSETKVDLIVGMSFEPYPIQWGSTSTIKVFLSDPEGRAVTDASVELRVVVGMVAMEGEHDESSSLNLESQGQGIYMARTFMGKSDMVLTGMSLSVQRGEKRWAFSIAKDEVQIR